MTVRIGRGVREDQFVVHRRHRYVGVEVQIPRRERSGSDPGWKAYPGMVSEPRDDIVLDRLRKKFAAGELEEGWE
jgi:hypothetical protein